MKSFKQFLNEMPAKIQSVGDFSGPSNMYHYGDDKIITIGAVKAEKLWEKSRGNFKLIFINDPSNEIEHIAPRGGNEIKYHEISKIAEFFRKRNQEFKPNDN